MNAWCVVETKDANLNGLVVAPHAVRRIIYIFQYAKVSMEHSTS